MEDSQGGTLYERVAAQVADMVKQGAFRPGDRVPSVRGLSRQLRVSIATVMEAYGLLENRGLIEARPQSGYYVRPSLPATIREPEIPGTALTPTSVSTSELAFMVMRDAIDPALIPLGAAIPNPEFLPIDKLNRMLGSESRRHRVQSVSYSFPPGCVKLRREIARRMMAAGCTLPLEGIVVTNGCTEAVMLALSAVCRPGDTVAVDSPTFFNTLQAIESLGLRALEIPSHPVTGISLDALRYAVEQHPVRAVMVISNFNNPLGSLMPDDHKRELAAFVGKRGIPLIEDDIYGDLAHSHERPTVAKAYDREGLVLLCSSFSKTIAPGYRVGWIAPGRYLQEVMRLKSIYTLANAVPTQLAIAEFLANGGYDHHLRQLRKIYSRQMLLMGEAVGRSFPDGTRVTRPTGGFMLWVEMPEGTDSLRLYERARKNGITIAPGPLFSAQGRFRNFIRLNAAFWSPKVERAIETLGRLAVES